MDYLEKLCAKKAKENNSICLNAYAEGIIDSKAPEMLKILNSIIAQINNEHVSDYLIQIQEEAKQIIKEATEL